MGVETIAVQDERAQRAIAWLTVERAAYGLLAIAAIGLRLWDAGAATLTPGEAIQALPATVAVAAGAPDLTGISPLLHTLQRLTFMLFGATEAAARFWPALIGGLAPLLFFCLRDRLTRGGALLAALLFAVSPLAVWSSRLAVGDALVPPLTLALIAALARVSDAAGPGAARRAVMAAAIVAGLLLISGPTAYTALLALAVAALAAGWRGQPLLAASRAERRRVAVAFGAAFALGSTFFLLAPAGLAAAFGLAGEWLRAALPGRGADYAAFELLARIPLSEFALLTLSSAGLIWAVRRRHAFGIAAALAAVMAWLVPLLGRGRQPVHLALLVLALTLLAGPAAARILRSLRLAWRERDAWLLTGVGAALLFAALLALPGIWHPTNPAQWRAIYLAIFAAASLLFIALWLAYGIWDSWTLVGRVLPALLLVVALGWQVSQMTALSFDRGAWRQPGIVHQAGATDLADLRAALRSASALHRGGPEDVAVDLVWPAQPGDAALALLRWELHAFAAVRLSAALPADPAPVVITPVAEQARLAAGYSGAEFPVLNTWRPAGLGDFNAILRWVLFRESRIAPEEVRAILWFNRAQ